MNDSTDSTDHARLPQSRKGAELARDAYFARGTLNIDNRVPPKPRNSAENYSTDRLTIEKAREIFNHMVEPRLDATFRALADPTRRGMLADLAQGEKSVGDLARPFAMSFAGAAKHVKVLEDAGLVERRRLGRAFMCSLRPQPLAEAGQWLKQWEKFWNVRLDRLEALIKEDQK